MKTQRQAEREQGRKGERERRHQHGEFGTRLCPLPIPRFSLAAPVLRAARPASLCWR